MIQQWWCQSLSHVAKPLACPTYPGSPLQTLLGFTVLGQKLRNRLRRGRFALLVAPLDQPCQSLRSKQSRESQAVVRPGRKILDQQHRSKERNMWRKNKRLSRLLHCIQHIVIRGHEERAFFNTSRLSESSRHLGGKAHLHVQSPQAHQVSRSQLHHLPRDRVESLAVHLYTTEGREHASVQLFRVGVTAARK